MSEYIKREDVEKMLENAQFISDGEYCGYCTEDVNISAIPSAHVVEVEPGLMRVVKLLNGAYRRAKNAPHVRDPLAYSLYQVWKDMDIRSRCLK